MIQRASTRAAVSPELALARRSGRGAEPHPHRRQADAQPGGAARPGCVAALQPAGRLRRTTPAVASLPAGTREGNQRLAAYRLRPGRAADRPLPISSLYALDTRLSTSARRPRRNSSRRWPGASSRRRSCRHAENAVWQGKRMSDQTSLADLRKVTSALRSTRARWPASYYKQFAHWLNSVAGGLAEPNAMTLATVGENGQPASRPVLIKGYDARHRPGTRTTATARGARSRTRRSLRCSSTGSSTSASCAWGGATRGRPASRTGILPRVLWRTASAWASPQSGVIPGAL